MENLTNPKVPRRLNIPKELPDPFIIAQPEGWYLTGSDSNPDRMVTRFPLYYSSDTQHWIRLENLLLMPDFPGCEKGNFWAPEIIQSNGMFYLYYTADSDGNPEKRFVRVAVSETILGPFRDAGALTLEPSIDGHPFVDQRGRMYFLYTGNEGSAHPGQLMMDEFTNPLKLHGRTRRVFPDEQVAWEEGPFLVEYEGQYMLLSSQGNWRDETYHLRMATSQALDGTFKRMPKGSTALDLSGHDRIGPGHCSIIKNADDKMILCFHAWDEEHSGRYPWLVEIDLKVLNMEIGNVNLR